MPKEVQQTNKETIISIISSVMRRNKGDNL